MSEEKPGQASLPIPTEALWHDIKLARQRERECELRVAELSEELKVARKYLETASEHLGELLDDSGEGQGRLPFESLADKAHEIAGKAVDAINGGAMGPNVTASIADKPTGNGALTMKQKKELKATRAALKDKIEQRVTDAGLTFTAKSAEALGTWLADGKSVMSLTCDQAADAMAKLDDVANDVIVNVVKSSGASDAAVQ